MRLLNNTLSRIFLKAYDDFKWLGLVGVLVAIFYGCDMSSTVEPDQDKTFIKLFGGSGSEEGKDMVVLPNSQGYILVGSSTSMSNGGKDIYIVRADNLGNLVWQQHFGGIGDDIGNSIILSEDGNSVYVCGEMTQDSLINLGYRDVVVLNLNINDGSLIGNLRTYGDVSRDEFGTDIIELGNGGFFISSTWDNADNSTYFLIETNSSLDTIPLRSRYIGTQGVNNGSATAYETFDPIYPFICFGTTNRTVGQGSSSWFHSFRYDGKSDGLGITDYYGSVTTNEYCTDAYQTADNGFILAGISTESNLSREMIVKIGNNQIETDKIIITNSFNRNVNNCKVFQTMDGGYIVSSTIELDDPKNDEISLLKLNDAFGVEWRKTYGSNEDDKASSVEQLEDGSYVLVGTMGFEINQNSASKMCLMKINPDGDLIPL